MSAALVGAEDTAAVAATAPQAPIAATAPIPVAAATELLPRRADRPPPRRRTALLALGLVALLVAGDWSRSGSSGTTLGRGRPDRLTNGVEPIAVAADEPLAVPLAVPFTLTVAIAGTGVGLRPGCRGRSRGRRVRGPR